MFVFWLRFLKRRKIRNLGLAKEYSSKNRPLFGGVRYLKVSVKGLYLSDAYYWYKFNISAENMGWKLGYHTKND